MSAAQLRLVAALSAVSARLFVVGDGWEAAGGMTVKAFRVDVGLGGAGVTWMRRRFTRPRE